MKIAVLYGGISKEREVSLSSGKGIIQALKKNGHEVVPIDFHPNKLEEIIHLDVDLVFIGLHGKFGEDGTIQGLLDLMNIPYVGSGVLASALAMDKAKAKEVFSLNKIPVANSCVYTVNESTKIADVAENIKHSFTPPFVIKPNREGSTLGLTIVKNVEQISDAILNATASDDKILVEDFLDGKEITVPVIGSIGNERALPIIEIVPKNDLYDYEAKYTEGGSEHIIPARINEQLTQQIKRYAVQAHQLLGCETYSRADFILTKENIPYILEVNTLPGMTPTSLFPDAAKVDGLTYEEMIEAFVQLSI
ncbi:D-alanine--D-alanine ligase family protein [Virgibacillus sp. W0430]|uniref:D-alanine--D-alanine ligase family protein n=1 Tax=Virgibacillus sp. W0430 TaxID=3391580 RepID=UPI003F45B2A1